MSDPALDQWMDRMVRKYSPGSPERPGSRAPGAAVREPGAPRERSAAVDAGAAPEGVADETFDLASGTTTVTDAALSFFEAGLEGPLEILTGLGGIVTTIVDYAASMIEAGELSRQALEDIVRRIATASANELVHRHRAAGLNASAVSAGELRSPAIEAHMRRDLEGWIVCARNVGSDREAIVQRALSASLAATAANITRLLGAIETAWRHGLERAAREHRVPPAQKRALLERAYAQSIARRRVEGLATFVERAIRAL